jgi:hypothetical protein
MREGECQVVDGVAEKRVAERIVRSRTRLRQAVRQRVVLQAQVVGASLEIVRERSRQQSTPNTHPQTPAVRAVGRIVSVPGFQNIKIEAQSDARMVLHVLQCKRDGLIHANEMRRIVGPSRHDRRTADFT